MPGPPLPHSRPSRVVLDRPSPAVDGGRFSAKASIGEPIPFSIDAFADGHDVVTATAAITEPDGTTVVIELQPVGNDRYIGTHTFNKTGEASWTATGWIDHWQTWVRDTAKKMDAGLDIAVELEMGATQLRTAAKHPETNNAETKLLLRAAEDFENGEAGTWLVAESAQHQTALHEAMHRLADRTPLGELGYVVPLTVDRERARFSAWYEFFPRSVVVDTQGGSSTPGTLTDAIDRLDYVADLGFDVVYLPPIHPIGITARKGPNNSTESGPSDPGSPWAIGGKEGGHMAIHPDLGTLDDVEKLALAARDRGMELALDLAFQCSPDHPWVDEHPEWFFHRPDGSIQFAENPPKKYQDIFPLDFESDDWQNLWRALRDVTMFWCDSGVRIFRVDNPHTKAFAFWEWMIAAVKAEYPDTLFLAEAFTRPAVMQRLAKVGFTQSYTYFPWRHTVTELSEYLTETSQETIDWFRPNSWPNTPDILTEHLQNGGRPAHVQRAILAATLTANYGVYGPTFELVEHQARPGSEEYIDNEKYELRTWDLDQAHSLAPLLTTLNQLRHEHPALQWDRTLHFHQVEGEHLLCFSKTWPGDDDQPADRVVIVVNVDPHAKHAGMVDLDLDVLSLAHDEPYHLRDLLGGQTFAWQGARNYVELDPHGLSAHIFAVESSNGAQQ